MEDKTALEMEFTTSLSLTSPSKTIDHLHTRTTQLRSSGGKHPEIWSYIICIGIKSKGLGISHSTPLACSDGEEDCAILAGSTLL